MASVRKLKPNDPKSPWIVEYTDAAGKRRRKTPKSGLKKDADALRQKIEREMGDEVHTPTRDSITVKDLAERYEQYREERARDGRLGYETFRRVATVIRNHIVPRVGTVRVCDLTGAHGRLIQDQMLKAGLTPRYTRDTIRHLLSLEKFAVRRGFTKRIATDVVIEDMRGMAPTTPIAKPTKEDVAAVLRTAAARKVKGGTPRGKARLECFVNLAAFCGLRIGEIIALRVIDVDFDGRVVRVRHSMTGLGHMKGPKTKAGVRDVPMPLHVRRLLREYLDHHHIENRLGLLFWCQEPWAGDKVLGARLNLRTNPIKRLQNYEGRGIVQRADIGKRWGRLQERAGLTTHYHFHALRHFCAAYWIENGMPLPDVSKLLGHAKSDVTLEVYAYAMRDPSRQHEAIESMAEAMLPKLLPAPVATKTRHLHVSD